MNVISRILELIGAKGGAPGASEADRLSAYSPMRHAQQLWADMYRGCAPWLGGGVKSLELPSAIASELARFATLELKSKVLGSGARAKFLDKYYQPVLGSLRRYVEYGCATGSIILKPYIENGRIAVGFSAADSFLPLKFDGLGRITDIVFYERKALRGKHYTRLERHTLDADGTYKIKNTAYQSTSEHSFGREVALTEVPCWAHMSDELVLSGVTGPLFGHFRVPLANTIDPGSPLGVSVYARAVGLIEQADRQYSRLLWEFESGERALYIDEVALRRGKDARLQLPDKRLYRLIDTGEDSFFRDWSPAFREQSLINGLSEILSKIEDVCGLARGTFSKPQEARTATELRILRQRSYATVTDIQRSIKLALEELVYAMDVWATVARLVDGGGYEMSFEFDDSSITDRDQEFSEKRQLVLDGVMAPWEFRMWYFGESEDTARRACAQNSAGEKAKEG